MAIPSTFESIAFWTSVACLVKSGSLEYFRVTPSCSAAFLAPARMMSQ